MHPASTASAKRSDDLLVEIIERLEAYGLEEEPYCLNDYVDVDALEKVLASGDGEIAVQFTIEGVRLAVSPAGVDARVDQEMNSSS
ncbi:hypothetical protein [Halobellus salinisoli]|uniref:hypothetical protein n=1 Tax=Halobellus salinisoli TaxID=3108500 RepID=UPI00300A7A92